MGNNRQQLRDNLAKDIQAKIAATKIVLTQLQESIETVEKNAVEAKLEVGTAADYLSRQLTQRKLELSNQIDKIFQSQLNLLRENVEDACVRLGNLQSLSDKLDLVDGSQLANFSVPNAPGAVSAVPNLELNLDTSSVGAEISKWGSAVEKTKMSDPISDLNATIASVMDKYLYKPEINQFGAASTKGGSCKLNSNNCAGQFLPCKRGSATASEHDPKDWQVEQWLSRMRIRNSNSSSTIADDFEVISGSESPAKCVEDQRSQFKTSPSNNTISAESGANCDDPEDGSSIVCVETDQIACLDEDDEIAKWLKPKKKKRSGPSYSDESTEVCALKTEPLSDISSKINICRGVENVIPVKNQKLDFPCLRADPNTWTAQRRSRNKGISNSSNDVKTELCLQVGQKEIIPPQYALPYPFWLKKY